MKIFQRNTNFVSSSTETSPLSRTRGAPGLALGGLMAVRGLETGTAIASTFSNFLSIQINLTKKILNNIQRQILRNKIPQTYLTSLLLHSNFRFRRC